MQSILYKRLLEIANFCAIIDTQAAPRLFIEADMFICRGTIYSFKVEIETIGRVGLINCSVAVFTSDNYSFNN